MGIDLVLSLKWSFKKLQLLLEVISVIILNKVKHLYHCLKHNIEHITSENSFQEEFRLDCDFDNTFRMQIIPSHEIKRKKKQIKQKL